MPPLLALDEALARGEVLAANTHESTHVIRVGDWVYKFLKPLSDGCWQPVETFVPQLRFRIAVSQQSPEFNALFLLEDEWLVVSRFIDGRHATLDECRELYRHFRRTGRGYIQDVGEHNVIVARSRLVVIDFSIDERHTDWCSAPFFNSSNVSETRPCRYC